MSKITVTKEKRFSVEDTMSDQSKESNGLHVGDVIDHDGAEWVVWSANDTKASIAPLDSKIVSRVRESDGLIQFLAKGDTDAISPDADVKVKRSFGREGLKAHLDDRKSKAMVKAGEVDVFEDIEDKDHRAEMMELAQMAEDVIKGLQDASTRYIGLVKFVRDCDLDDEEVVRVLKSRGYNDARVSEIHRVAHGSEDILKQYEQRVIGFKQAVEQNRAASGSRKPGITKAKMERMAKGITKLIAKGSSAALKKLGVEQPKKDEYVLDMGEWEIVIRHHPEAAVPAEEKNGAPKASKKKSKKAPKAAKPSKSRSEEYELEEDED
jgi:hypothetical protein